ncbi:hypothetical protein ES703_55065 [subsurface metagenome]
MAARWVDLLLRFEYTLDQADADLDDAERNLFYSHVQGIATRRAVLRRPLPAEHPLPAGDPLHARDPTGD